LFTEARRQLAEIFASLSNFFEAARIASVLFEVMPPLPLLIYIFKKRSRAYITKTVKGAVGWLG